MASPDEIAEKENKAFRAHSAGEGGNTDGYYFSPSGNGGEGNSNDPKSRKNKEKQRLWEMSYLLAQQELSDLMSRYEDNQEEQQQCEADIDALNGEIALNTSALGVQTDAAQDAETNLTQAQENVAEQQNTLHTANQAVDQAQDKANTHYENWQADYKEQEQGYISDGLDAENARLSLAEMIENQGADEQFLFQDENGQYYVDINNLGDIPPYLQGQIDTANKHIDVIAAHADNAPPTLNDEVIDTTIALNYDLLSAEDDVTVAQEFLSLRHEELAGAELEKAAIDEKIAALEQELSNNKIELSDKQDYLQKLKLEGEELAANIKEKEEQIALLEEERARENPEFKKNEVAFNIDREVQKLLDGGALSYEAYLDLGDKYPQYKDELHAIIHKQNIPVQGLARNGISLSKDLDIGDENEPIQTKIDLQSSFAMASSPDTPDTSIAPELKPEVKIDLELEGNPAFPSPKSGLA